MPTGQGTRQESWADQVTDAFLEFCGSRDIVVMTTAIDKYGSLVWEGGKRDTLNRYITLSFTPAGNDDVLYDMATSTGADNGVRYARASSSVFEVDVRTCQPESNRNFEPSNSEDIFALANFSVRSRRIAALLTKKLITSLLSATWQYACRYKEKDLTAEYPISRSS